LSSFTYEPLGSKLLNLSNRLSRLGGGTGISGLEGPGGGVPILGVLAAVEELVAAYLDEAPAVSHVAEEVITVLLVVLVLSELDPFVGIELRLGPHIMGVSTLIALLDASTAPTERVATNRGIVSGLKHVTQTSLASNATLIVQVFSSGRGLDKHFDGSDQLNRSMSGPDFAIVKLILEVPVFVIFTSTALGLSPTNVRSFGDTDKP
jgi:hypothetical protein